MSAASAARASADAGSGRNADLAAFLEHFRPDGYTTFVGIVPDGSTVAETFNGADPGKAAKWIESQNRARNVYFTVNPTAAGQRRKPLKSDITAIAAVWADIDPRDDQGAAWAEERKRLEALAAELHALQTPPSFIVDSGNGIQPVRQLDCPIEATDEYRQAAESLCAQIEAALGAKGTHTLTACSASPAPATCPMRRRRSSAGARPEPDSCAGRGVATAGPISSNSPRSCAARRCAMQCQPRRRRSAHLSATWLCPMTCPSLSIPSVWKKLRARHPDVFDLSRFDGDQSRQDLALAALARRLGWSQQDAWRLIIAVRGDQKACRRDYIERTLARAYASQDDDETSDQGNSKEARWPEPQPLPSGLLPVEPSPLELLPDAFAPWVADVAERMQVPADYVAIAVMVAAGSTIGRQLGIRPKRHDDWTVIPNLWGDVIGRPGLLKTPAIKEALRPIRALECDARAAHEEALKVWEARVEIEREAKKLRATKIREQLKGHRNPDTLARELAEDQTEIAPPVRRRFMTNDATVAKLGELLRDNPRGILVFRDELMGWLRSMETEGREGDRAFYLEAWNGTGRFTYDRIGRGTVEIEAACVSFLGSIQPLLSYSSARHGTAPAPTACSSAFSSPSGPTRRRLGAMSTATRTRPRGSALQKRSDAWPRSPPMMPQTMISLSCVSMPKPRPPSMSGAPSSRPGFAPGTSIPHSRLTSPSIARSCQRSP